MMRLPIAESALWIPDRRSPNAIRCIGRPPGLAAMVFTSASLSFANRSLSPSTQPYA